MNTTAAPAVALRYADLLAPVDGDAPCGPDLEYDPAFVMLQTAVAPRRDAQYGDFVDVPQPANWAEIERDCRALLLRTKDLRIATTLLRCRTRQGGANGLRDGLAFVTSLLERYGEALHPSPTSEGERDPVMFANALGALADQEGLLADLRDVAISKVAGVQLHVRDIEKAFAAPRVKEALAPESATRVLSELWARRDATAVALADAHLLVTELVAWCATALGGDAPNLDLLQRLLQPFASPLGDATPGSSALGTPAPADTPPADAPHADTPPDAAPAGTPDALAQLTPASAGSNPHERVRMDRWSALATIRDVRIWFEQNEPSSPVVVLLRQSERMVGKRFSELAQVIPAELLAAWDSIDS